VPALAKNPRGQSDKNCRLTRLWYRVQFQGAANVSLHHAVRLYQVVVTSQHHEIVECDTAGLTGQSQDHRLCIFAAFLIEIVKGVDPGFSQRAAVKQDRF